MQDAKLEKWWNEAAGYRSGGFDRMMIPAPWTRTIEELTADGVRGAVYAHEMVTVAPGTAADFLELVRAQMLPAYSGAGFELVAAMRTSMIDESECLLIWAIPTGTRGRASSCTINDPDATGPLRDWQATLYTRSTSFRRFLMLDAPLSPLQIGRQPARSRPGRLLGRRVSLPLEGLLVVGIEQAVAAPLATRHLADMGARVVKIENPKGGDFARDYDDAVNGIAAHFIWCNRGKESLTLDLRSEAGAEVMELLLAKADVLIQNLAPGAAAAAWAGGRPGRGAPPASHRRRHLRLRRGRPAQPAPRV